ncbi:MAG: 3'-5' exonuclease [Nanoarchaeota archaeon]|nr:3'-5' exonuclease [Nanoarchaeota archaeon]
MIVVDLETTGLNPERNSIVSIGAVDFFNPENQFYGECKIWPGAQVDSLALEVNGFSIEEVTNPEKESLGDLLVRFFEWAGKIKFRILAGHNTWFDSSFLLAAAEKHRVPWIFPRRIVDLHSEGFTTHVKKGFTMPFNKDKPDLTSGYIHTFAGLPEEPTPHNALTGAKMEAESFSRLIYGKSLLEEFSHLPVPDYLKV